MEVRSFESELTENICDWLERTYQRPELEKLCAEQDFEFELTTTLIARAYVYDLVKSFVDVDRVKKIITETISGENNVTF